MRNNFKELLQASFKSNDTEEWLDVHFTRPIGLAFALLWDKLGIHPNVITIVSWGWRPDGCFIIPIWRRTCGVSFC